jgi:ethanolamine utilization protein EutQ (cupin superfamily)
MTQPESRSGVTLLRETDMPFEVLAPGREVTQVVDRAGVGDIGGGFFRQTEEDAEYTGRILGNEVLFVYEGELEVAAEDGTTVLARAGEAILIAKDQTVTFRGKVGTRHFWVIHPAIYE